MIPTTTIPTILTILTILPLGLRISAAMVASAFWPESREGEEVHPLPHEGLRMPACPPAPRPGPAAGWTAGQLGSTPPAHSQRRRGKE